MAHEGAIGASETGLSTVTNAEKVFDDEISSIVSSFMEDGPENEMRSISLGCRP